MNEPTNGAPVVHSADDRWAVYSPESIGMVFYPTYEDACEAASRDIDTLRDTSFTDGWPVDEPDMWPVVLKVAAVAVCSEVEIAPESLDEEGYDEQGEWWDADHLCRFDVVIGPLPSGQAVRIEEE